MSDVENVTSLFPGSGEASSSILVPYDLGGRREARREWARRQAHAPLLHGLFLLTLCAFLVAQPLLRERGGLVFWLFLGISLMYVLASSKPALVLPLLGFTIVGVVYVLLSYLDALPDAWTQLYEPSVIPRQAYCVVFLYPLVLASASMWSYASRRNITGKYFFVLFVSVGIVAPFFLWTLGSGTLLSNYASATTKGLGNERMLFYMALSYFLLVTVKDSGTSRTYLIISTIALFGVFFYLVYEPQYQNMVIVIAILVLSFVKPYRSAIIAMVVIVGVLYLALIPAAMNVYGVDPNSGFRMVQTTDALSASIQSHGLGVGYGKETSKVDLTELVDTARTELAMNGVHNAFAEAFMRLGVLGGLFLLWLCVGTCAPPREGPLHLRRHLAAVYLMLLTAVLFNVALESPTYIVGVSTAIGYILATKDSLAQPDSEYRSAQDRRIQASGLQPGVLS